MMIFMYKRLKSDYFRIEISCYHSFHHNISRLKSDYFRIEIDSVRASVRASVRLKSDYFRIEICLVKNGGRDIKMVKIRLF